MEPIFYITDAAQWYAAAATGVYTGSTIGKTLDEVGFIHCSFEQQVQGVADFAYRDVTEPLVLLTIDPARVEYEIKIEQEFPHIYGPLHADAVIAVREFHA